MFLRDAPREFLFKGVAIGQDHELDPLLGGYGLHDRYILKGPAFGIIFADDEFSRHNFDQANIVSHDESP